MTPNNSQERKTFPQCNALDDYGKRCRKRSAIRHHYHGDQELYSYRSEYLPRVAWVEVNVCPEHAMAIGYDFSKPRNKQRD